MAKVMIFGKWSSHFLETAAPEGHSKKLQQRQRKVELHHWEVLEKFEKSWVSLLHQ